MSSTLYAINKWASLQPQSPAVTGQDISLTYHQLQEAVCKIQDYLEQRQPGVIGLLLDNSPAWVAIDLAAQAANITLLPIPGFFSAQQILHTMEDAGCDFVITDQPERFESLNNYALQMNPDLSGLYNNRRIIWEINTNQKKRNNPEHHIAKITYTSGTTGTPKGVCLQQAVIDTVALSLCKTVEMHSRDRHLCALPLSTLLENIAGIYVPLLAGAQCFVYPLEKTGLRGATQFDAQQYHRVLNETNASTTVLVPHLLQELVELCEQKHASISSLRFIAVGGAPIAPELLNRASRFGLPVYEGYGLSECASVVAVNNPQQHRVGSVGKPLQHITIKFADDGEILVKEALSRGYLGQTTHKHEFLATGDIGYLDDDGYLYVTGRKKNMFITAFGRNVSPEWVERELVLEPSIRQAAVFGEGRPWNVALIVPADLSADVDVSSAIEKVNAKLPDYARIKTWIAATESFQLGNQQLTATGRLRRNAIWQKYAKQIEDLYLTNNDPYRKTA